MTFLVTYSNKAFDYEIIWLSTTRLLKANFTSDQKFWKITRQLSVSGSSYRNLFLSHLPLQIDKSTNKSIPVIPRSFLVLLRTAFWVRAPFQVIMLLGQVTFCSLLDAWLSITIYTHAFIQVLLSTAVFTQRFSFFTVCLVHCLREVSPGWIAQEKFLKFLKGISSTLSDCRSIACTVCSF